MDIRKSEKTHLIEINTQAGTLRLDGMPIEQITTACTVRWDRPGPARVELSLLADVILCGDALVMTRTSRQEQSEK